MNKLRVTTILVILLALLVMPISVLASDILGSKYYAVITISNNGTAETNVATTCTISTPALIAGNYLNSSANNSVLRTSSGADVPFAHGCNSTLPMCIWVPSIGADSYTSDILYTANSSGGLIRYFPGDAGATITDNETMELGDNFTVEIKGWVDTDYEDNKNLIDKPGAFQTVISGTENITAMIHGDAWVQRAPQLNAQANVYALAVYNDKLYGVTGGGGRLFEWDGVNTWVQVAPQHVGETIVQSLAVYNGKLYGGTGINGMLLEWNGINAWAQAAPQLGAETKIYDLIVYNDKLYGGTGDLTGELYEWDDVNAWVQKAPQLGAETRINSLAVYNGKLYGGTGVLTGELYEWNDVNAWVQAAPQLGGETRVQSLAVYNGKLYGGTGVLTGELYEWNDVNAWVQAAPQLGGETAILSLAVYNGKLYGGTGILGANLYEWDDTDTWIQVAPLLGAELYIRDLAVYNGRLYGSTGIITGELYEWDSVSVTATGVSSVEHTVKVTGNVTGIHMYIDSSLEDIGSFPITGGTQWVQKAPQLGVETILSIAVYNDKIYAGTSANGSLYEWNGVNAWVLKAPRLGTETSIRSLAVYNGKLYGGTGDNGMLYEWDDVNAWVQKAPKLGTEIRIYSLVVHNDKLYGGTGDTNGSLYEWNGVNLWVSVAPKLVEPRIYTLAVYNGKIYGGTSGSGSLYEWNGADAWVSVAPTLGENFIFSLVVYDGKLYGGTGNAAGNLYEWNGTNAWVSVAADIGDNNIYSLVVYNGKIYGGTGNAAGALYEWNGTNAWVEVAPNLVETSTRPCVYDGKIYAGTGPNGNLYEWDAVIVGVPDTSANWTLIENNVMPYMEEYRHSVNGTLVSHIMWEYDDTTFTDLTLTGNDAYPSFRTASSDAEVSANFTSFLPISEAQAPTYALDTPTPFVEIDTANITDNWTVAPAPGGFPLAGVIIAIANATDTPPQLPLLTIAVFAILALSLAFSSVVRGYGSGTIFVKILVIAAVMGVFVALGNFGLNFWMIIIFLIISSAWGMMSKSIGWSS